MAEAKAPKKAPAKKPVAAKEPEVIVPEVSLVESLIALRPLVEDALLSPEYPDFIKAGLSNTARGLRVLESTVRQDRKINH